MSSKSIKIVCISDTHGRTDDENFPEIPDGDILLHAGDITQEGSSHNLTITQDISPQGPVFTCTHNWTPGARDL